MKKTKVFIIEDVWPIIKEIIDLTAIESIEIIPSRNRSNESIGEDYTNQNNLQYIYDSEDCFNRFKKIIESVTDIDLFIIDISLTRSGGDTKGKEILEYLISIKNDYNNGNSDIILLSEYGEKSDIFNLLNKERIKYISKDVNLDCLIRVKELILMKHELTSSYENEDDTIIEYHAKEESEQSQKLSYKESKEYKARIFRHKLETRHFNPAHYYFDKIIMTLFGTLLFLALIFAFFGISRDFYRYYFHSSISNKSNLPIAYKIMYILEHDSLFLQKDESENSSQLNSNFKEPVLKLSTVHYKDNQLVHVSSKNVNSETNILKVVENIFIYLLPLFILFGFYNYYASTTAVRLRGDGRTKINYDTAFKGINTSKIILLSSLLSYTLINAIDRIFITDDSKIETKFLIAYGGFIIILMVFIILISKDKQGGKEKYDKGE